jgi:tRNA (uracil-5-)-methyltransferase TRM9
VQATTIQKLNQLNQLFYQRAAIEFDQTRQKPWSGWPKLLPGLTEVARTRQQHRQPLRILDLGGGNGRFGIFVAQQLTSQLPDLHISYCNLDSDPTLLQFAQLAFTNQEFHSRYPFFQSTCIQVDLLKDDWAALLATDHHEPAFDIVVLFGVLHHVPGQQTRQTLLRSAADLLAPGGKIIVTVWQFVHHQQLMNRALRAEETLRLFPDLEDNDFILDW